MLKQVFCLSAAVMLLWASMAFVQEKEKFTADRHKERGVTCEVCHGDAQPSQAASAEKCLTCHQSLEAVAEKTKDFERNPHQNHLTESMEVECTQCHYGHKADDPICHRCHSGLKFEKMPAETK